MEIVSIKGVLNFNPSKMTKKHERDVRKVCLLEFGDTEICKLYSWFVEKEYHISLLPQVRTPHVTIVNTDISFFNDEYIKNKYILWNNICEEYDSLEVDCEFDLNIKGNERYLWFNVTQESRIPLLRIREKLGLEKPKSGLHMTIGRIREDDRPKTERILNKLYNG